MHTGLHRSSNGSVRRRSAANRLFGNARPLGGALLALTCLGCPRQPTLELQLAHESIEVQRPGLYPETLEYDATTQRFLVSSLREGAVYRVDNQGAASLLVSDPRLCSVLGIAVDARRGRLWAVNSDLGVSLRASARGPKKLAAVGIYDLNAGTPLRYVDLGPLSQGDRLLNGIALDSTGDAYVTDSLSPAIYKVDASGNAAVFLGNEQFTGAGINLNGIVVHPDGYLLVVKKNDGSLFKVPLSNPEQFSRVDLNAQLVGGDGLLLLGKQDLVVVANQTPLAASNSVFSLKSTDGWSTGSLQVSQAISPVYPTTAVLRGEEIYLVHSQLNELLQSSPAERENLRRSATILRVGRFGR